MYDTIEVVSSSAEKKMKNAGGEDKDLSRVESAEVVGDKEKVVNHLPRWRIVMIVSAAAFFLVLSTIIVWLTIITEQQQAKQKLTNSALRLLNTSGKSEFRPDEETHPVEHYHPTTIRSDIDLLTTWIMTNDKNENHPATVKSDVDDSLRHNEIIRSSTVESDVIDNWLTAEVWEDGAEAVKALENTTEHVAQQKNLEEEHFNSEFGSGSSASEEQLDENSILFMATSPPIRILDEQEEEFEEDPIVNEATLTIIKDYTQDSNNYGDTFTSETEGFGSGIGLDDPLL